MGTGLVPGEKLQGSPSGDGGRRRGKAGQRGRAIYSEGMGRRRRVGRRSAWFEKRGGEGKGSRRGQSVEEVFDGLLPAAIHQERRHGMLRRSLRPRSILKQTPEALHVTHGMDAADDRMRSLSQYGGNHSDRRNAKFEQADRNNTRSEASKSKFHSPEG